MINRDALTGEGVEGNEGGFYFAILFPSGMVESSRIVSDSFPLK